jgi:hypothetical protein
VLVLLFNGLVEFGSESIRSWPFFIGRLFITASMLLFVIYLFK